MRKNKLAALVASALIVTGLTACTPAGGKTAPGGTGAGATGALLAGSIETDGSSTVYPLSEAVIEEYILVQPNVRVTASPSGSSAGIERLINGEIDIAAASRPIKPEELETAKGKGIDIIELQVAIDGIAVVTNPGNPVTDVSLEDLKKIFAADSTITSWNQANASFPDLPLTLFSPGTSSGTFEFFTDHVLKTKNEQRASDVQVSEDDNVLVTGVSGTEGGLGYFGYTYYEENMDKLKGLKVAGVEPTQDNILSGEYPLSRPVFLYVNKKAVAEKPEVKDFLTFYLDSAIDLAIDIKMVPATQEIIDESKGALVK